MRQTPALTWVVIDKALRSRSVGEHQLADSIRESFVAPAESTSELEPRQKMYEEGKGQEDDNSISQYRNISMRERVSGNCESGSPKRKYYTDNESAAEPKERKKGMVSRPLEKPRLDQMCYVERKEQKVEEKETSDSKEKAHNYLQKVLKMKHKVKQLEKQKSSVPLFTVRT